MSRITPVSRPTKIILLNLLNCSEFETSIRKVPKLFLLFFSFITLSLVAQTDTSHYVHGNFIEDSLYIGENIHFTLSAKYPKDQIAIFPDSSSHYFPFEYINKKYVPTRTDSLFAYDSVIYVLASYEVINKQFLSVPVKFIFQNDTQTLYSIKDSMFLKRLVTEHSERDVKADALLIATPEEFNYPYLIAIIASGLTILFLLYKMFGDILLTRYRLFILRNAHNKFIKHYDDLVKEFNDTNELRLVEQIITSWKNYLTRLEDIPINTYTTKELIHLFEQEELESTLQSIDRNVYGGMITTDISDSLQVIKRFTHRRFQTRRRYLTGG
jgi:hypothetical protein